MPAFDDHYTDEQRDALCSAWNDQGIRPAARVASLAMAGELTRPDGTKIPSFGGRDGKPVPEGSIRSFARDARRRRRGEATSSLAEAPPRDAVEMLRRRLVSLADHETARLERAAKRSGKPLALGTLRELARAVLEISRLPGPTDPRPPSPGTRDAKGKKGPQAFGGLAGALLKDHRGDDRPVRQELAAGPENDSGTAVAAPDDPAAFVAGAVARLG